MSASCLVALFLFFLALLLKAVFWAEPVTSATNSSRCWNATTQPSIRSNFSINVFLSEVSRINGEVQAEVTSSFELDKAQQSKVESAISEATGVKKIVLSTKVDETLIGGLIVKIGSKMIDNSIKTKLNRLEIAMRGTN